MEYKAKYTDSHTTSTRDKSTWNQPRTSKNPLSAKYISSVVPNGTRDPVHKPSQSSNANHNREFTLPKSVSPSSPRGPTEAIVNANSIAAQSTCGRVHISWGNCGKPRSFAHRRFLEEMAEEVAVQEGFEHAKIL